MENDDEMKSLYFTGHYKTRQSVITIYDSSDYYILRQHVIAIYDGYVVTIHDTCYYISRQVLQYTTSVITIHDRYYNSRYYYISRQHTPFDNVHVQRRSNHWQTTEPLL